MDLRDLQQKVVETGIEVFGETNIKSVEERTLRFAEEAFELIRAQGLPLHTAMRMLVDEYHERQKGEVSQEIAGVQSTLLALADSQRHDVETLTLKEMQRILDKKDVCRLKHQVKPAYARAV